jgi:cysteinyl-tRNA synthetase
VDWRAHAAKYTAAMYEDLDKLGCLRPEKEPRASEYIAEMLAMIRQLIDNGYAYQAADGDVMYDVRKFATYGKLSGKKLDDLRAGSRVGRHRQTRPTRLRAVEDRAARRAVQPSPWATGAPAGVNARPCRRRTG